MKFRAPAVQFRTPVTELFGMILAIKALSSYLFRKKTRFAGKLPEPKKSSLHLDGKKSELKNKKSGFFLEKSKSKASWLEF